MSTDHELIIEDIDTDLTKCLFSKEFELFIDPGERKSILAFLDEVQCSEIIDVETKKKVFLQYKKNSDDENLKCEFVRCNSRLLYNAIMNITQNTLSFQHLKNARNSVVIEDFYCLIYYGKLFLPLYVDFYDEYDSTQMYKHLHDVVKMMIGKFYNAIDLYLHHSLRTSYIYRDKVIYLNNNDLFDWKNVYVEVWCVDHKHRTPNRIRDRYPPILYPICIDMPLIKSQETIQLPVDKRITGATLTNEIAAICLWCKEPRGIGFHKVINNLFLKKLDTSIPPAPIVRNFPVFINDFDRNLRGWPTNFP